MELSSAVSPQYIWRVSYDFFAAVDVSSVLITRTLTETASKPSADAVISAVPSDSAVIFPLLTAATDKSDDSHTMAAFLPATKDDFSSKCVPTFSTTRSLLSSSV